MNRATGAVQRGSHFAVAALLLVYAYNVAGFAALHLVVLKGHRSHVRSMPHFEEGNGIVRISVPRGKLAAINWRSEDEFHLDGHLYDVLERTETSDSVVFVCFDDIAERELEASFAHHLSSSQGNQGAGPGKTSSLLPHHAPVPPLLVGWRGPRMTLHEDENSLPPTPFLDEPSPPPRVS